MVNRDEDRLMFIEPKLPATRPVLDELTALAWAVLDASTPSSFRYRGFHTCVCGRHSDNADYSAGGKVTNSLLPHYVACHRSEVPDDELTKLNEAAHTLGIY